MSKSAVENIIEAHGAENIAKAIGVNGNVVRMWKQRKRIPAEHWRELVAQNIATLEELADAAARPNRAA